MQLLTFEEYAKLLKKLGRNEEAEECNAKAEDLKEKFGVEVSERDL